MAIDHFIKHKYSREKTDWNFNILFNEQPQVAELAERYKPIIKHPGLYEPVPRQWLHATILRVGFLEEFSESEMLAVADILKPKLANMEMPELVLGQRWWLWNGGPVLSITPKKQINEIFQHAIKSLSQVVGKNKLPVLTTESKHQPMKSFDWLLAKFSAAIGRDHLPVRFQFIPHITLAYPKTHHKELELFKRLKSHPIDKVTMRAEKLSLIKQRVENNYYVWEAVEDLPIGQSSDIK